MKIILEKNYLSYHFYKITSLNYCLNHSRNLMLKNGDKNL